MAPGSPHVLGLRLGAALIAFSLVLVLVLILVALLQARRQCARLTVVTHEEARHLRVVLGMLRAREQPVEMARPRACSVPVLERRELVLARAAVQRGQPARVGGGEEYARDTATILDR
jgi:hypothetical protein